MNLAHNLRKHAEHVLSEDYRVQRYVSILEEKFWKQAEGGETYYVLNLMRDENRGIGKSFLEKVNEELKKDGIVINDQYPVQIQYSW